MIPRQGIYQTIDVSLSHGVCLSLPLSLSLSPSPSSSSLKSINTLGEDLKKFILIKDTKDLAGVAKWVEHQPAKQSPVRVPVRAHAWAGGVQEASNRCFSAH